MSIDNMDHSLREIIGSFYRDATDHGVDFETFLKQMLDTILALARESGVSKDRITDSLMDAYIRARHE